MTELQPPLRWTGHALVDVGIAGICALGNCRGPGVVELEQLDRASEFIAEHYFSGKLDPYLSVVFTNNSGYCGPNKVSAPEEYSEVFRPHRVRPSRHLKPADSELCVFCHANAHAWIHRQHLPLFSAQGILNFRPNAQGAVPACASCILALQFLPMAGRRAEGRMLLVHADDPELTIQLARRYLEDNRRLMALALPLDRRPLDLVEGHDSEMAVWDTGKKRYKYGDVKGPRSFVVHELAAIAPQAAPTYARPRSVAVTCYLASNSGQGPSLEIFDVPGGVVSFVFAAQGPATQAGWADISRRFKPVNEAPPEDDGAKRKARKKASATAGRAGWTRNAAFEDLCGVFDAGFVDRHQAASWLRRHVLGRIDARAEDSRYDRLRSRSWALADLFLKEVIGMKQARIDAIRGFADKLAQWIHDKNDRKLERALFMSRDLRDLRRQLLRSQAASVQANLLFGLEEYATVWLHEDGDQYLVRDLVCIRVVEKLHDLGRTVDGIEEIEGEAMGEEATA